MKTKNWLSKFVAAVTLVAASTLGAGVPALAQPRPTATATPTASASAAPAAPTPTPTASATASASATPSATPPPITSGTPPVIRTIPTTPSEECKDLAICEAALKVCEEKKDCDKKPAVKPAPTKCGSGTKGEVILKAGSQTCECKYEGDVTVSSYEGGVRWVKCVSSADFVREFAGEVAVGRTLLEQLKKDTKTNADKIALLEPRVQAAEDGLKAANSRIDGLELKLMLLDEAVYVIQSRLEKFEKQVEKKVEGAAGPSCSAGLRGEDGLVAGCDVSGELMIPVSDNVAVHLGGRGGLAHSGGLGAHGRGAAQVGLAISPGDGSHKVVVDLLYQQDVRGEVAQRDKIGHFPGYAAGLAIGSRHQVGPAKLAPELMLAAGEVNYFKGSTPQQGELGVRAELRFTFQLGR